MKRSLGAGKCSSSHLLCSQFSRADNYLRQGSTGASLTLMEADLNEYTQAAGCCNLLRGLYDANVSSALCMCVCHGEAECCSISRMLPPGIEAGVSLQQVSLEVYTLYITSCPTTPPKQSNRQLLSSCYQSHVMRKSNDGCFFSPRRLSCILLVQHGTLHASPW